MPKLAVVLGFDFGLSKIGVAVGQCVTKTARPLTILKAKKGIPNWENVSALINEWHADALIVGLPLNMDGSPQPITERAKSFGQDPSDRFKLPVHFIDERLTTIAAKELMHATLSGKARFAKADSVSAQLIVESWLGSQ